MTKEVAVGRFLLVGSVDIKYAVGNLSGSTLQVSEAIQANSDMVLDCSDLLMAQIRPLYEVGEKGQGCDSTDVRL